MLVDLCRLSIERIMPISMVMMLMTMTMTMMMMLAR